MQWLREVFGEPGVLVAVGVLSAVLSVLAFAPYVGDILARKTKPQRSSWLVWSVLSSVSLSVQVAHGASSSLWFAGAQVAATVVIFLLSIRLGAGSYCSGLDLGVIAAAAVGLVLWFRTDSATYALGIAIGISLLGGLPTVLKAVRVPESETLGTWILSLTAACLASVSVGTPDLLLLAYPIYLMTLYSAFVFAILLGRSLQRQRRSERLLNQKLIDMALIVPDV